MDLGIIIALSSLVLSLVTIYLTQFRPPNIFVVLDPEIQIYHTDFDSGISTGFLLPITFVNKSSKTGVILETRISIYKESEEDNRHLIRWREFQKSEGYGWRTDQEANSLAIKGKSSISKTIWFHWFSEPHPTFFLTEGNYILDLYVWHSNNKKPRKITSSFIIDKDIQIDLQNRIDQKSTLTRRVFMTTKLDRNMILTEQETSRLIE